MSLERLGDFFAEHKEKLALTGILLIAAFFRFYQINELPPGLHPDEAANGIDVFRILNGEILPFYPYNNGREGLFFFIQALMVMIFGNTMLALHLAPALTGFLAVLVTYLAIKQWFSIRAALLAAFIMASAPWAVTMSRLGFRANLIMLFIPLVMWTFAKALRTGKWYWYVLSGVALGGGFYTYISFRIVPFIILFLLGFAFWRYRPQLKQLLTPLVIVALSAALTLMPMVVYAVQNPDAFLTRNSHVSFTNPDLNDGKPVQTLAKNTVKTALMFNFKGDENFRHNLGGAPMLNAFVGIMFVLGLLLALRRIFDIRYFALLAILGAMLVPEVVTAEGIPHALRAIGAIPAVYIFAAIGIVELIARWRGVFPRNPIAQVFATVVLAGILILSTAYNYQRYFVAWANAPETYKAHNEELLAASNYAINNPIDGSYYIVVDGYSKIAVDYLTRKKVDYVYKEPEEAHSIKLSPGDAALVVNNERTAGVVIEGAKPKSVYSKKRIGVTLFTVYQP